MEGIIFGVLTALLLCVSGYAGYAWNEGRKMRTLFDVSLRLNSTIKRKELLRIIMETAAKTLRAEGSSIILVDKEKEELYFEVATGNKHEEVKEIRLKLGEGIAGWVAKTGQPVLIKDASKDARWSNRVADKVNVPTRNMLCVPVTSNGEVLGVLQVINRKGSKSFLQRDLRLLELISSPTAIALENMFLYEALVRSMETLRETTAAKERIESELKIAQNIQRSFLPGDSIRLGGVEVQACLHPARVVGGDFYHFMALDEKHLLVCLGDVSDKGMPAALFMSGLMIWIRAKAESQRSPSAILSAINREISTEDSTMFATIFLMIIDTETGRMRFADGGHCTPFIVGNGAVRELPTAKRLPIGIFPDGDYEEMEAELAEGESLLLYTDGITEAENGEGQWFGSDRLISLMNDCSASAPNRLRDSLLQAVFAFAEGNPQSDDIALMTIHYDNND